jgi:4-carboxymuconolactone decarboxylase
VAVVIREKLGKVRGDNATEVLDQVIRKRNAGPPAASPSASSVSVGPDVAGAKVRVEHGETRPVENAPAEHFDGPAHVQRLFQASDPARASGASVTFDPGARTAWHTHPLGQTLIVTAGTGWVQQWGEPAQRITTGDVAIIPAGVKHWHGAAATTPMTHIAIQEQIGGSTVQWMERVTEEQYRAAR